MLIVLIIYPTSQNALDGFVEESRCQYLVHHVLIFMGQDLEGCLGMITVAHCYLATNDVG